MKKVIPIMHLAAQFANVQRVVMYPKGHVENDAEHSFQLALSCWMANKQYDLGLSDELIMKYALVHDLVEVYAGDTDAFADEDALEKKKVRERSALNQLKREYGAFRDIFSMIERYETKQDIEAQLVYVIDKFLPSMNISYSNDNYYKTHEISHNAWRDWLASKIDIDAIDARLKPLLDESISEIDMNYLHIFDETKK